MKLTKEQRTVLEEYFHNLGLTRADRALLFRYIRNGCNWDAPLMVLGDPTTGKSTLRRVLIHLGVCVYSPHELQSVTLKKRIVLTEENGRYIRGIYDRLGIQ